MKELLQIGATIFLAYLALAKGVQEKTHQPIDEKGLQNIINHMLRRPLRKQLTRTTNQTKFGEVFDCVDIDRQPAFHHPLLKNHSLQMKPSSYPAGFHFKSTSAVNTTQSPLTMVACPARTIPILRKTNRAGPISLLSSTLIDGAEIAGIKTEGDIHGVRVSLNIYEPKLKGDGDFSAQMFNVMHGGGGAVEAIAAGSMVSRNFGDSFARFHILWLEKDQKTCMDFHCPGFVQTSEHIGVGGRITPVSTYKGKQVEVTLILFQDPRMRNWWLFYDTKPIGYWPGSLFTELRDGNANIAVFGGYVWGPMHDPPEMGSGHFANEREGKAAYARNIKRVDMRNTLADLDFAKTFAYSTKPPCYTVDSYNHNGNGAHVYYGGPGGCHPYPSVR